MTFVTWGETLYGQLGIGDQDPEDSTTMFDEDAVGISHPTLPAGVVAARVSCGFGFTVVVSKDGRMFSTGANETGQLGIETLEASDVFVPVALAAGDRGTRFVGVSCGYTHTVAIATDGSLYAWGSNQYGELGIPPPAGVTVAPSVWLGSMSEDEKQRRTKTIYPVTTPRRIPAPVDPNTRAAVRFEQVACGYEFTVGMSTTGVVYAWGKNARDVLGCDPRPYPVERSPTPGVDRSSAAAAASASASPAPDPAYAPTIVPIPGVRRQDRVVGIACGDYHVVAWTQQGELYTWGENSNGQLGFPPQVSNVERKPINDGDADEDDAETYGVTQLTECVPRKVAVGVDARHPNGLRVVNAACGVAHTAVVVDTGDVYSFGEGIQGQIGEGALDTAGSSPYMMTTIPRRSDVTDVVRVVCGGATTAAICRGGTRIRMWGDTTMLRFGRVHVVPVLVDGVPRCGPDDPVCGPDDPTGVKMTAYPTDVFADAIGNREVIQLALGPTHGAMILGMHHPSPPSPPKTSSSSSSSGKKKHKGISRFARRFRWK